MPNSARSVSALGVFTRLGTVLASALGLPAGYDRERGIVYQDTAEGPLTLDVFRPRRGANGLGVIWVVSGAWISSRDGILPIFVGPLIRRGYTVFPVVHRSLPMTTMPAILAQLDRATRFVRSHAPDFGVDPDRLGIYGGSAGGHLSLMQSMAGQPGNPQAEDPIDRVSSRLQAVACFFPPTDFLNYGPLTEFALGLSSAWNLPFRLPFPFDLRRLDKKLPRQVTIPDEPALRELARTISPIYHVSPNDPPTFLMHGDADRLVPLEQSQRMLERLQGAGVPAELVVKPGADHGWLDLPLDLDRFADWFDEHLASSATEAPVPNRTSSQAPDPADKAP